MQATCARPPIQLSRATPDLTTDFHELNRFFDLLAYNPQGKVPVTGNAAQDAKRDQGYLFWIAWLTQTSTSLFNTSDAEGALRRYLISANCTTLRQLVAANPASGPLLGLTNPLNDTGLCPSSGSNAFPVSIPPLPIAGKKGASIVVDHHSAKTVEQKWTRKDQASAGSWR